METRIHPETGEILRRDIRPVKRILKSRHESNTGDADMSFA